MKRINININHLPSPIIDDEGMEFDFETVDEANEMLCLQYSRLAALEAFAGEVRVAEMDAGGNPVAWIGVMERIRDALARLDKEGK